MKLEDSGLKTDLHNANLGTQRGRGLLEKSLRKLGAGRSILADKNGNIVAGNKTLEGAAEIGLPVRIVETDGKELVVVKRMDLDLYSETDKRGRTLAYADNKIAELDLSWSPEQINADFAPLDLGEWGFVDPSPEVADAEPQIDRAAELNAKWKVKTGDLWRIGDHRLLCGDSTVRADVERVMDIPLNLMVTDPPYGVEYESDKGVVTNDDKSDWSLAYELFNGDVLYIWHGERTSLEVGQNIKTCGFDIRGRVIWVKPSITFGRGNYHFQHEGAWYGVRKGKTASWCGDSSQSSVWNIAREDQQHPTVKPIECMARPIQNHAGDVYEPFAGSGTTLVACQNLSRKCRAIEISPNYCSVILQRMSDAFPDIEIERISNTDG